MKILILIAVLLSGCSEYSKEPFTYKTESQAAIAFTKSNMNTIEKLTKKQELLGWIVRCEDGYHHTTPKIGSLKNVLHEPWMCNPVATVHTHPNRSDEGLTTDFFSKADLHSTGRWNVYLFSKENCAFRVAKDSNKKKGELLGVIRCSTLGETIYK